MADDEIGVDGTSSASPFAVSPVKLILGMCRSYRRTLPLLHGTLGRCEMMCWSCFVVKIIEDGL